MDYTDHIFEIVLRLSLVVALTCLEKQTPFVRFIEEEELWLYRYPSVPPIIPKNVLYLLILMIPALVYSVEFYINKNKEDIIKGAYALTLTYGINGIFTSVLKLLVGRPRPNFFFRCFPDGYGTDINECTGEFKGVLDARKSFPSAHASFIFAGMFFISLHLFRVLQVNKNCRLRGCRFALCCLPMLLAVLVGVSRTCDYHHHYSDVLAGSLLGLIISSLTFYTYYAVDDESDNVTTLTHKSPN